MNKNNNDYKNFLNTLSYVTSNNDPVAQTRYISWGNTD